MDIAYHSFVSPQSFVSSALNVAVSPTTYEAPVMEPRSNDCNGARRNDKNNDILSDRPMREPYSIPKKLSNCQAVVPPPSSASFTRMLIPAILTNA